MSRNIKRNKRQINVIIKKEKFKGWKLQMNCFKLQNPCSALPIQIFYFQRINIKMVEMSLKQTINVDADKHVYLPDANVNADVNLYIACTSYNDVSTIGGRVVRKSVMSRISDVLQTAKNEGAYGLQVVVV